MGLLPKNAMHVEAGSIRLEGEELTTKSDAELRATRGTRMAMVFQEPMTALNPVERVGDQIGEVLEIHTALDPKERRKRVLEIMRSVHLPDPEQMIDAYPHQLSGGQRQRIMIAAALVLDPALLIADEPTTALDVTTQAQILKLVREMQARKKTGVLFITHDFGVVSEIADRVVVMQLGRIVEQGPCEEVLRNPREDYTKMLLAAVPSMTPPKRVPVSGPVVLQTEICSRRSASSRCCSRRRGSSMPSTMCRLRYGAARRLASSASPAPASRRWRVASPAWSSRPKARSASTTSISPR